MSNVTAHPPAGAPAAPGSAAGDAEQLARLLLDDPTCVPDTVLDAYLTRIASPAHATTTARRNAWADYVEALRIFDGLECGLLDWTALDPDLTGFDRQEVAVEIAADQTREALHHLTSAPAPARTPVMIPLRQLCRVCIGAGCLRCFGTGQVETRAAHTLAAFLREQGVQL